MWYCIHAQDRPDSLAARIESRPAHLARLQALLDQGRLLVAGPLPAIDSENPGPAGFTGSMLIVRFESLDEARQWADEDPYVEAGVYTKVNIYPFKRVLPR